jgi:four helix bundle protein
MTQFSNSTPKYNLEERTGIFGENIILLCKTINFNHVTKPIIDQLIRSGTGIGANYCEANGASSKKDFRNKIFICKKESQETKHWLRMLKTALPEKNNEINKLWNEAQELTLIFQKICSTLRKDKNE